MPDRRQSSNNDRRKTDRREPEKITKRSVNISLKTFIIVVAIITVTITISAIVIVKTILDNYVIMTPEGYYDYSESSYYDGYYSQDYTE